MDFIKEVTENYKVEDKTYTVYIRFYFQNHYTRDGLLYRVEVLIQDYDRPIKRIDKYCVLNMEDVGHLCMKDKEYVFNNIILLHPNDLEAEAINIRSL
jgi:hypothetical protein